MANVVGFPRRDRYEQDNIPKTGLDWYAVSGRLLAIGFAIAFWAGVIWAWRTWA